jgi:uncharacterized protein YegJ (DUF2314 family)
MKIGINKMYDKTIQIGDYVIFKATKRKLIKINNFLIVSKKFDNNKSQIYINDDGICFSMICNNEDLIRLPEPNEEFTLSYPYKSIEICDHIEFKDYYFENIPLIQCKSGRKIECDWLDQG